MDAWQTVGVVVLTAILTWIGHAVVANQQRKLDVAKALEQHKRDLYARFLDLFFDTLKRQKQKERKQLDPQDLAPRLMDIARDMTVYASDNVLKLFVEFRTKALSEQQDPRALVDWFGRLIVQMRKDLGYTTTTVKPRDVLSLFIIDIDNLYPEQDKPKARG